MFKKIRNLHRTVTSLWSPKKGSKDPNLERAFEIIKPALADSASLPVLEKSQNLDQLLERFQTAIVENEILLATNRKDSLILENQIESRTQRVRDTVLGERERLQALRHIKGLQTRLTSLKKQAKIYSDNIDLHEQLKNRVKEMAALSMKTVETAQIDDLSVTYQEARDSHRDTILAGKHALAPEGGETIEASDELEELKALEAEIMSEPPSAPLVVTPAPVPVYVKREQPVIAPTPAPIPFFESETFQRTLEAAKQQNDAVPPTLKRPAIEIQQFPSPEFPEPVKPRVSLKFPRRLETE